MVDHISLPHPRNLFWSNAVIFDNEFNVSSVQNSHSCTLLALGGHSNVFRKITVGRGKGEAETCKRRYNSGNNVIDWSGGP
jgi:hypothetical protein